MGADYSQLSDLELNKLTAKSLGFDITAYRGDSVSIAIFEHNYQVGERHVNYCSDPREIMPIAIENKIGLSSSGSHWEAEHTDKDYKYFHHEDENPYRAIVICYLKMLEV